MEEADHRESDWCLCVGFVGFAILSEDVGLRVDEGQRCAAGKEAVSVVAVLREKGDGRAVGDRARGVGGQEGVLVEAVWRTG